MKNEQIYIIRTKLIHHQKAAFLTINIKQGIKWVNTCKITAEETDYTYFKPWDLIICS